jgi:hypothetical protein
MILKDGIIYQPIFSEFAIFLVNNTTYNVYYVDVNSSNNSKILLTKHNIKKYCDLYDKSLHCNICGGSLFLCLGELPKMNIKFNIGDNPNIQISESYNSYNWLNWT